MLSVKTVSDKGARFIKLVYDEVSIVLLSGCEYNYFEQHCHFCQESPTVRPDSKLIVELVEVY